jgi:RimJ/RimL family protein N-acetyltransferase
VPQDNGGDGFEEGMNSSKRSIKIGGDNMMMIETDRLYLAPLTTDRLRLWVEDITALEKELDCVYRAEPMTGVFLDIVKGQLEIAAKDEANYLYHSFWFLIRKIDRIVVGSAAFKDIPNKQHEVEIGYGQ